MTEHGLLSLFILSFGASTILPLGSEWYLVLEITRDKPLLTVVGMATLGNYLGAMTTYIIGRCGATFLITRVLRVTPERAEKNMAFYRRFGVWSLLFTWLPVVGDPLVLVAGACQTNVILFSLLTIIGKGIRYFIVATAVTMTIN
jgi:membrane protein YqaA with SNARE-associated domain